MVSEYCSEEERGLEKRWQAFTLKSRPWGEAMAAGDITFIECPRGDSFPVRKTADRSSGSQQVVCPKCGHSFDVIFPESVERLSRETVMSLTESFNHASR
jgi:transposase-like protein